MSSKIRVGVLSAGAWSVAVHIPELKKNADVFISELKKANDQLTQEDHIKMVKDLIEPKYVDIKEGQGKKFIVDVSRFAGFAISKDLEEQLLKKNSDIKEDLEKIVINLENLKKAIDNLTPDKKAQFKSIMENDRKNNPEKYEIVNAKRKEKMNTAEFKENMSNKKKRILNVFEVFDKTGKKIEEFDNTVDCVKYLNIGKSPSIVKCLNGDLRQSCGYIFKYKS
jgi:hypothetical protein